MNDLRRWMDMVLCEGETVWHGSNEAFRRFAVRYIGTGQGQHKYGWGFYFSVDKSVAERIDHGWAGVDGYPYLARLLGSNRAASKTLDRLGIAGNKYLGRDDLDGHGTRNYVVFNPRRIKLLGSELVPHSVPRGAHVGPYRP